MIRYQNRMPEQTLEKLLSDGVVFVASKGKRQMKEETKLSSTSQIEEWLITHSDCTVSAILPNKYSVLDFDHFESQRQCEAFCNELHRQNIIYHKTTRGVHVFTTRAAMRSSINVLTLFGLRTDVLAKRVCILGEKYEWPEAGMSGYYDGVLSKTVKRLPFDLELPLCEGARNNGLYKVGACTKGSTNDLLLFNALWCEPPLCEEEVRGITPYPKTDSWLDHGSEFEIGSKQVEHSKTTPSKQLIYSFINKTIETNRKQRN